MKTWLIKLSTGKIIPLDKMLHFFIASFLSMVMTCVGFHWIVNLIIVAIIAFLKEVFDWKVKNSFFDPKDFIATVLGAIVSIILLSGVLPLFK